MKTKYSIHFTASRGWVPLIIRWLTRAEYNHTFISYERPDGCKVFVDIDRKGVHKTKTPDWRWTFRYVEFRIKDKHFSPTVAAAFIRLNLGKKYDYLGVFGFAWHILLSKLGLRYTNRIEDRSKYFCSEFVTKFLRKSGSKSFRSTRPRTTSPEKLYRLIASNPKNFEII